MSIYYFAILFFICYGYVYQAVACTTKRYMNCFFVLCFSLLFGFRYKVGVDWYSYIGIYKDYVDSVTFFDTFEIGYKLINLLAIWINTGIVTVIFVSTLLFAFFTIFGIARININPYYFLALVAPYHFIMSGMNYTRQAIALSVMLAAFGFLLQKKMRCFFILALVAGFFHISAWCFILLIFIDVKLRYLLFFLAMLIPPLLYEMLKAYHVYLTTNMSSSGLYLRVCYLIPCIFFILINYKKMNADLVEKRLMLLLIVSFPLLILMSIVSSTVADRFSYYFILLGALLVFYQFYKLGGWNVRYLNRYGPLVLFISGISAMIVWNMFSTYIQYYEFHYYFFH